MNENDVLKIENYSKKQEFYLIKIALQLKYLGNH